jgi:chromosome segregation protein
MKLTRLKLVGFKSFVEPTEFLIEPGLTGVVGPNGCGKSNLVEALRWVMGESSYKSLRASGMDDVIFSGSGHRPSRNMAEVALHLDNTARTAPAAFNDLDQIEVSRRIEREAGSHYRVNSREVRARDVQLLFADAATGARSHAMVRQGQIGEIISAKPQARRRILEDAAGIAGLHSRRHEAELRLKAAEENIRRVDDVLNQIDQQVDGLKRQSRQASRYKNLAADIRKIESLLIFNGWRQAVGQVSEAERAHADSLAAVQTQAVVQTQTARDQAVFASELGPLREAEVAVAAGLQRLTLAMQTLESEEKRALERAADLEARETELKRDLEREETVRIDAEQAFGRLASENEALTAEGEAARDLARESASQSASREAAKQEAEAAVQALRKQAAELLARRSSAEQALADETRRIERITAEFNKADAAAQQLAAENNSDAELAEAISRFDAAQDLMRSGEQQAESARQTLQEVRLKEQEARKPLEEAERQAQRYETEARTLSKLLAGGEAGGFRTILADLTVEPGLETALGAVLGEDLEASLDDEAPRRWTGLTTPEGDPALPEGVRSFASHIKAPDALARRLRQIGLVEAHEGPALVAKLQVGQRLVSPEGHVWRWDGLVIEAGAPSAAALRLAEKNRLAQVELSAQEAREKAAALRAAYTALQAEVQQSAAAETAAMTALREQRLALEQAQGRRVAAERRVSENATRKAATDEALARLSAQLAESRERHQHLQEQLQAAAQDPALEASLSEAELTAAHARQAAAEAAARLSNLEREAAFRTKRQQAIVTERQSWEQRISRSVVQISEIGLRLEEIGVERRQLAEAPDLFQERRRRLREEIDETEARRRDAADRLAEAETKLAEADKKAREALAELSSLRENAARLEARLEASRELLLAARKTIVERLEIEPEELATQVDTAEDLADQPLNVLESRLEKLKEDRERLGAVNLRADDELSEIEARKNALDTEKQDLTEAIRRLRGAIGSLNREGRERLLKAFEEVKAHFERLFNLLFGGGTARLELIESDDPLEAGLEIVAHPPGKKPQTMTLLSGGEQALTAIALIFAVFLTNPSPICVLDEVDAPLDDANVERYCDLLADMASQTETRFVVITHNPITMARMNRLYGVTMAERGVSQLVSVDLGEAASLAEAG